MSNSNNFQALAELACAAWRLRRQSQVDGVVPPEITKLCASLTEFGLEIKDHTGVIFGTENDLEVLAFEPAPQLSKNTVIETLRPSVSFRGKTILRGLVVVGTPQLSARTE